MREQFLLKLKKYTHKDMSRVTLDTGEKMPLSALSFIGSIYYKRNARALDSQNISQY